MVKLTWQPAMKTEGELELQQYPIFNLCAIWGGWLRPHSGRFTAGKRPGTHFRRGWVNFTASLDRYGKPRRHRDPIGPSSRSRVATTTCANFLSAGISNTKTKFSKKCYSTSCPLLFYFCVVYKTLTICLSYSRLSASVWDSVSRKQWSSEKKYLYKNIDIWDLKQTFCIVTLPKFYTLNRLWTSRCSS